MLGNVFEPTFSSCRLFIFKTNEFISIIRISKRPENQLNKLLIST